MYMYILYIDVMIDDNDDDDDDDDKDDDDWWLWIDYMYDIIKL